MLQTAPHTITAAAAAIDASFFALKVDLHVEFCAICNNSSKMKEKL